MEIRIKLVDADRSRLLPEGADEWISVNPFDVSLNETIVIQKGVEIEGTVCSFDSTQEWRNALSKGDAFAAKVLVWIGLRRIGVKVPLAELDADAALDFDVVPDPTDPGEPGKEPDSPETTS
jgi:hypothetical protein